MVKMLQLLSVTTVIAAGDDSTSLLQQTVAHRVAHEQSVGTRILTAVARGGEDTICLEAAVGDIAPLPGSFTATMSQQAVEVAAGTTAEVAGSFCVQRQDVLLLQRTYGLNTANDIEAALVSKNEKKTTTTTTTTTSTSAADVLPSADNFETFDFAGDTSKKVMVDQCPDKSSTLTQTMEVTVSNKGTKATTTTTTTAATKKLDADQMRVCSCRNFLKDGVQNIYGLLNDHAGEAKAGIEQEAANDGADAVTVKAVEGKVESDIKSGQIVADLGMVCTQAKALKDWTLIAKMINHPTDVVPNFQAANITGWEHCAKSWIIEGACAEIVKETSLLQNNLDKTVQPKTKTTVSEDAAGNKKTETVTRDRNGKLVHSHTHVHNARTGNTETATQSKDHRHSHQHNSKSAQTVTRTVSKGHTHEHLTNAKTGQTVTDSTGANGYQHHHDHTHTHVGGITGTATNSETKARSGAGTVRASHSHVHIPGQGRTETVSSGTGTVTSSHTAGR
jgi:hypothetical protein